MADLYFLGPSCHHPQSFHLSSLQTQCHCHHPEHLEGYCRDESQPIGSVGGEMHRVKRKIDSLHTLVWQSQVV